MLKFLKPLKQYSYYIFLILLVIAFNVALIFNDNLWCDEAFIVNACKLNYQELLSYIKNYDMRPPLYLIMVKTFSLIFGTKIATFKFFSIIPAILTMIVGVFFINTSINANKKFISTTFVLLTGLSPIGLTKNIEITIYSWTLFFVTSSVIFAYRIYLSNRRKDWILFTIMGLGAAATHYYALITEVFIYLFLFVFVTIKDKKKLISCIICSLMTIICYAPILPCFYYQFTIAKKSFWILNVDIFTILKSLRMPFEGENAFTFSNDFTMFFLIFIISSFIICIKKIYDCAKNKKAIDREFCFCLLLGAVIILLLCTGYVLSRLIRPLFVTRYMYTVTGILWLFISIMAGKIITNTDIHLFCIGAIVTMALFSYPEVYHREYSTATKESVSYLETIIQPDDIFVNNQEECASWVLEYYFPQNINYINCSNNIYYKDKEFDFSTLNTTAWYFCSGAFDLDSEYLTKNNLICENYGNINLDNYYYFTLYKITPIRNEEDLK